MTVAPAMGTSAPGVSHIPAKQTQQPGGHRGEHRDGHRGTGAAVRTARTRGGHSWTAAAGSGLATSGVVSQTVGDERGPHEAATASSAHAT